MSGPSRPRSQVAYYTVADTRFFPGVVALLNSLRLAGEEAPLFVVDCGLTDAQRERLADHVTFVAANRDVHPGIQKAAGPLTHPAEIMVLIDADILVTRPLTPLFADASRGLIVGFEDKYYRDRCFPEWSSLGLGNPRKHRYVNSGLLIFSAVTADELLPLFVELQAQLDPTLFFGRAAESSQESNPFYFADQDIFNALFCTRFDGRVVRLDHRLAPVPPFPGIEVLDGSRPACAYADGVVPYALHHILKKPWLSPMDANPYSDLFTKVVTNPQAPVRLGARDVPRRLTDSRLAPIDQWWVSLRGSAHRTFRGKLGVRPAVERRVQQLRSLRQDAS